MKKGKMKKIFLQLKDIVLSKSHLLPSLLLAIPIVLLIVDIACAGCAWYWDGRKWVWRCT